ncbi:MAG: hypothetical protein LBR49_07530 [Tannerella sp.]|nr:hypothetical protein [Tannerella sp.]
MNRHSFTDTLVFLLFICITGSCTSKIKPTIPEPYKPISGSFTGEKVAQSPDPLVSYRWENPQATDSLEIYTVRPVSVVTDHPENAKIQTPTAIAVSGECNLMFDFGQINAAWFEFDSDNLDGAIEASISEFNEPAIFNAGAEHPAKTAVPVRYGNTYRLELNRELYEGVRFAWIHIHKLNKPALLKNMRLVCQIRPTNYEGSFSCSDTMLTRIWYTGAYDVKLNLLQDYFGAILMERSDRISWTGDAHPSQAAALVAFGNYDFIKANLRHTSTQFNGILSYSLYWTLSLVDYFYYTGDKALFDEMKDNLCAKLDMAYSHFDTIPPLGFYGWDERLGAGFEDPNCEEVKRAYRMLCIRAWNECSMALESAGYALLAAKYKEYAKEKAAWVRTNPAWIETLGVHAAADAVNAGFTDNPENEALWQNAFSDRQQRLSYSPFNQYFIIQSMAKMERYNEAVTTINDCWGGQVRYGGTTFFEVFRPSWNDVSHPNDAPVNNQCGYTSLTHPWSAGVTKWLSEEILGIKPVEPGFKSFAIKPHLSGNITCVKGAVPTPSGKISFAFDIVFGKGEMTIPPGKSATLAIPKTGRGISDITFNDNRLTQSEEDEDFIYFSNLTEGNYKIKVIYNGLLSRPEQEPFIYELAQTVNEDTVSHGNWTDRYGTKGYFLCNYDDSLKHRVRLPDFVESVTFLKNDNIVWQNIQNKRWANKTDDARALLSPSDGKSRNLGAITTRDPNPCYQTMTVDIKSKQSKSYRLSLYFVDWERDGRRSAIEIFDLENKKLLMPVTIVRNYENGNYLTFNIDRPIRIRIDQVRGKNAALSGIFFD